MEQRIRLGRRKVTIDAPAMVGQPLIVNYGMGTDSTAMLVLLHKLELRPDMILFADTGNEKPETYAYLEHINTWLEAADFPQVTVVRIASKDASLYDQALRNFTLPSLAFGGHSCSLKWKAAAIDKYLNNNEQIAIYRGRGGKVIKCIGYDDSPADRKRTFRAKGEDDTAMYWFPLQQYGITRPDCIELIDAAGLDQPGKSACYFCPAAKKHEVDDLLKRNPRLVANGLKLEAVAQDPNNKHGGFRGTKGLGRSWNWREYLESNHPAALAGLDAYYDTGWRLVIKYPVLEGIDHDINNL